MGQAEYGLVSVAGVGNLEFAGLFVNCCSPEHGPGDRGTAI